MPPPIMAPNKVAKVASNAIEKLLIAIKHKRMSGTIKNQVASDSPQQKQKK